MQVSKEWEYLVSAIQFAADPRYSGIIKRSIPSDLTVHGLRISDIRRIVRDWLGNHQDVSPSSLLRLIDALWSGASREERLVALELLQQHSQLIRELDWELLDRWRRDLDNWELTDVLGLYVLGPWVALDLENREEHLWDLLREEDMWSKRLSLISGIGVARTQGESQWPNISLHLVDHVKDARNPLIVKAVSWALRELGKRHREEVANYLHDNDDALAPQVLREVTNKLQTGRKDGRPGA